MAALLLYRYWCLHISLKSVISYCIPVSGGIVLKLDRAQRAVLKVMISRPFKCRIFQVYQNCKVLIVRQLFPLHTILRNTGSHVTDYPILRVWNHNKYVIITIVLTTFADDLLEPRFSWCRHLRSPGFNSSRVYRDNRTFLYCFGFVFVVPLLFPMSITHVL